MSALHDGRSAAPVVRHAIKAAACAALLTCALLPLLSCDRATGPGAAAWTAGELLLVPLAGDSSVLALDAETNRVVRRWRLNRAPAGGVALSPDGGKAAVREQSSRNVLVADLGTGAVRRLAIPVAYANYRDLLMVDGRTLAVAVYDPAGVLVLDAITGVELRFIAAPEGNRLQPHVTALSRSPDGRRVWATQVWENQHVEVDVHTGVIRRVTLDEQASFAQRLTYSPDGRQLWGVSSGGGISIRDPETAEIRLLLPFRTPGGILFSADGARVYAREPSGVLRAIDASTGGLLGEIRLNGNITGMAVSSGGEALYVALHDTGRFVGDSEFIMLGDGTVVVLDAVTLAERGRLTTGRYPLSVAAAGRIPRQPSSP